MDLRARAAWTSISHFPEVVVLVAVNDVVGRNMLQPEFGSLFIPLQVFLFAALENGHVEVCGIQFQDVHQILPRQVDGSFLEVVSKRPVAQHLEHGVVIGVVSHFFQVVVLSANAEAFLAVSTSAGFWVACAQDDVFELVHASVGEHEGWIILDDHRCGGHYCVSFRFEKFLERIADFVCCHSLNYLLC